MPRPLDAEMIILNSLRRYGPAGSIFETRVDDPSLNLLLERTLYRVHPSESWMRLHDLCKTPITDPTGRLMILWDQ